jgi:cold shock protein
VDKLISNVGQLTKHVSSQKSALLQKRDVRQNPQKTPSVFFASQSIERRYRCNALLRGTQRFQTRNVREFDPLAQYKGTVKWFNNAKGYGFLGREGGADVFVHYSSIQREGYKSLKEGDEVEFDIIQGTKGPQADQVSRLKEVNHEVSQANP